ncbi:MAG: MATE family efflux transporter [Hyphomicrobiaceae bacterium]|nr:MATE family efflux transporter [Hyphomicrobiaceae bacterium]
MAASQGAITPVTAAATATPVAAASASADASSHASVLLRAPILPTLLRLTVPNLAAMVVIALVSICETAYVGILGTTQLAAIALVFPMVMLMQMLSAGAMGGGVSSAISRALGAGDIVRANALALHAAVIGMTAGLFSSAIFVMFSASIFRALGGSGAVLGEALAYANIALTAAILTWLLNTFASIVRGTGNMRVPSLTLLVGSGLQIMLGGALGFGIGPIPRFGLAGVASGLVIAYASATLFLLWFLATGRGRLTLRFNPAALDGEMFRDILKVGAISAVSPFQVVLTVLILTRLVAGFGTEALAGYGIGARLEFLLIPIVFAIGVASVPMVGMAMGARQVERARQIAWTAAGVAMAAVGAIGLVVTLVPDVWSGLFSGDAAVRAAANLYLRSTGWGFAFVGVGLSLYFASQGSGKVLGPVLAGTIRLLVVAIGGCWLAASGAPAWALFAVVGAAMAAFGLSVAAAVYLTPWGR